LEVLIWVFVCRTTTFSAIVAILFCKTRTALGLSYLEKWVIDREKVVWRGNKLIYYWFDVRRPQERGGPAPVPPLSSTRARRLNDLIGIVDLCDDILARSVEPSGPRIFSDRLRKD
jgi:hypothetical protein